MRHHWTILLWKYYHYTSWLLFTINFCTLSDNSLFVYTFCTILYETSLLSIIDRTSTNWSTSLLLSLWCWWEIVYWDLPSSPIWERSLQVRHLVRHTALNHTTPYCTALHCAIRHCTAQHRITLCCTDTHVALHLLGRWATTLMISYLFGLFSFCISFLHGLLLLPIISLQGVNNTKVIS